MKFNFFTFGGAFFWEDVFFYQKWRIQRHCGTKTYRLLDSWDIRRASGTFEECQKAFIKYIDRYEITKQQGKLIVLLHGYLDGKNIFKPLWRKLVLTNATVAAINYPSLFRSSLASAYQLLFFLNHMEDITEVSFVTKGAGNLILRQTLNLPPELQTFQEKMRIRNIVEINPVIKSSFLCDLLSKFRIFRLIGGPMLEEMTEKKQKNLPSLPNRLNSLKIFSDSKISKIISRISACCHFPARENLYRKKDAVFIDGTNFQPLKNEKVLNCTVKFINNGKI